MKLKGWAAISCLALAAVSWNGCDKNDDDDNEHPLSEQDSSFLTKAAYANQAEIFLGQLATGKGGHDAVKAYGQHMVADHARALQELDSLADRFNIDLPVGLDAEHQIKVQQLNTLSGYSFDTAYLRGQVKDHIVAITLHEQEATTGRARALRSYANKQLPHLRMHKAKADSTLLVVE